MGRRRSTRYSPGALTRLFGRGLLVGGAIALWWAARRFERFTVTGSSMEPTLEAGDRLLVWKTKAFGPGDIVVAPDPRDPGRTVLKRATRTETGQVWLEGDNPGHSTDSRHFGAVPAGSVRGKVVYRYFPPARAGRAQ